MIDLSVSLGDTSALVMLSGLERQLPFAMSVAINNTLNDVQTSEREHVHRTFTLRRSAFIDRTIYIGPKDRARKDRLEGTVRINPERDFLAKFEDDTVKRPRSSATLAVPVFRQGAPGIIISRSDPLNVKKLLASIDRGGRLRRGKYTPKQLARQSVFLVHARDGRAYLIERTAMSMRVLYVFEPSVPIQPDLHFKEIALATALNVWPERAAEALKRAIDTAR